MLGAGGRVVRCTECKHTWFQESGHHAPEMLEELPPPAPEPAPEAPPSFEDVLNAIPEPPAIPQAVTPVGGEFQIPMPIDDRPLGMGARQFGFSVFVLLTCLTLLPVFLSKDALVSHFPAVSRLYKVLHFDIRLPGEGLRLSEMKAIVMVEDGKKKLQVTAKLANIVTEALPSPVLAVTAKGPYGAELKTWKFRPDAETLAPGEVFPLKLEFKDMPDGIKAVDMKVVSQ